jgi:ferredoxin-NADP reductase
MTTRPAVVAEIRQLAPAVVHLTSSLSGPPFEFRPGQWVNFRFPEGVSRAYMIASPPQQPQSLELCVRIGGGKGGAALRKLAKGAEVGVEGPFGKFVLPDGDSGRVVFLAGDTGIAPVRSIVLHLLAVKDPRPITVLYEPDRRHILYSSDFDPLARSRAIVHESGDIEVLMRRNRRILTSSIVMAAGFDGFLGRCTKVLNDLGVEDRSVFVESFGPEP